MEGKIVGAVISVIGLVLLYIGIGSNRGGHLN